jgi:hypothetical protein
MRAGVTEGQMIKRWTLLAAIVLIVAMLTVDRPRVTRAADGVEPIARMFFEYYYAEQRGPRVLGPTVSGLLTAHGRYSQFFEKGRIESHPDAPNPAWRLSYGRLVPELLERGASGPVSGETVSLSYADLRAAAAPERRVAAPQSIDGPQDLGQDGVFVPYNAELRAAAGQVVPRVFWTYLQRTELFPGGWLHDVGLPLTRPLTATVVKGGVQREITIQAFERAILTADPLNPPEWRIERANLGRDYLTLLPFGHEFAAVLMPISARFSEARDPAIGWDYPLVEGDFARVYLIPDNLGPHDVDPAWVFLQRQGSEWQIIGGPGTAFNERFYAERGIPALLHVGDVYERSLYDTIRRFYPTNGALQLVGAAGGFALVRMLEPTGAPGYIYLRLTGVAEWTVAGPPATSFTPAFYEQQRIPRILQLEAVR